MIRIDTGSNLIPIGFEPLYLTHSYDVRQIWFSFVEAVITDPNVNKPKKKNRNNKKRIEPPKKIYFLYEQNVPQRQLPFVEHRRINSETWQALSEINFPSFDRDEGKILSIIVKNEKIQEHIESILNTSCIGRYYIKFVHVQIKIFLETKKDFDNILQILRKIDNGRIDSVS